MAATAPQGGIQSVGQRKGYAEPPKMAVGGKSCRGSTNDMLTEAITAAAVGILASAATWLLLHHLFAPRIRFSPNVSRVYEEETTPVETYRIKIHNIGWRSLIDVAYDARVSLHGFYHDRPSIVAVISVPAGFAGTAPSIRSLRLTEVRNRLRRKQHRPRKLPSKIIRIRVGGIVEAELNRLPKEAQDCVHLGSLKELLKIGSGGYLRLYVYGYDAVTGSRRLFVSPKYRAEDIRDGYFKRNSLSVTTMVKGRDRA